MAAGSSSTADPRTRYDQDHHVVQQTPRQPRCAGIPERVATHVAWSDDNGRTWRISPQAVTTEARIPAFKGGPDKPVLPSFWEASIVERIGGSLLMIGRTYGGALYETLSSDGGETWKKVTAGLPTGLIGKGNIAVVRPSAVSKKNLGLSVFLTSW